MGIELLCYLSNLLISFTIDGIIFLLCDVFVTIFPFSTVYQLKVLHPFQALKTDLFAWDYF